MTVAPVTYKGFTIVPTGEVNYDQSEVWIVTTDGKTDVLPEDTLITSPAEAYQAIDVWLAVGGDVDKFCNELVKLPAWSGN